MTTGTEAIRTALIAKNRKLNIASLARDIGSSPQQLESFMASGALSTPVLILPAKYLWPHARFNPATDMMEPADREPPRPTGVLPPPYVHAPGDYDAAAVANKELRLLEVDAKPKPKRLLTRPGWLGGWL